jgi:anti-sigma-K factor RskA
MTRFASPPEQAAVTPAAAPQPATPAQQRDELLRSAPDVVSATWVPGNMKDLKVTGDIVWSDSKQQGYVRLHGLPVNDASKTCYQLWIFDQTQDKATPIDGGVFDVASNGDVILPVTTKLTAKKPEMFALTIERHGGVVVSKREKIAALAKVETHST